MPVTAVPIAAILCIGGVILAILIVIVAMALKVVPQEHPVP